METGGQLLQDNICKKRSRYSNRTVSHTNVSYVPVRSCFSKIASKMLFQSLIIFLGASPWILFPSNYASTSNFRSKFAPLFFNLLNYPRGESRSWGAKIKTHGSVSCGQVKPARHTVSILTGRTKTRFSRIRSSVLPLNCFRSANALHPQHPTYQI